ncbi:MAG: TIGR02453 family protein [Propionibacteriales bacterium]|nr:TIGR02453 family protein [Propionibacteriales bacterium]
MTFTGIPDEALEFYEGLAADNTKTYWTANKQTFENAVRAPVVALCEALSPEFGSVHLFRPYRDLRFAKNRSPYKEQQGATVGSCYFHISAEGLFAAVGYYQMGSEAIARYREAVDDNRTGRRLERLVAGLRGQGYTVSGNTLKTRPRGYPADHPRIELLRHRSLVAWHTFGAPDWLQTGEAAEHIAAVWRELLPLHAWLERHVGPAHPG